MRRRAVITLVALAATALPLVAADAPPSADRATDDRATVEDRAASLRTDDGPLVFAPTGMTTDRFAVVTAPERVEVPAHDGVMLHARVYRPDTSADPDWRTPVVLVHSPYYDGMTQGDDQRSLDLVEHLTPKGYTVVLSDVRGTGNSGGCAEQDGPNQAQDFATLVEHFAAQPWSNGRVGSYGKSYDAETQNAGVVLAPEGLATMVTVAGIASLYDVAFYDAVPMGVDGVAAAAVYVPYGADVPGETGAAAYYWQRWDCQPANFLAPANLTGDKTAYWQDREFRTGLGDVREDVSVLHVHGLHDGIVTPIAIDGWYDELPGFTRAIWGQWEHKYPYDAPAQWARDDWYPAIHAWFDAFLLDLPTGVESWPPVQVQDDRNDWRAVGSFAAMGTDRVLQPDARGGLVEVTETDDATGEQAGTATVGEDTPTVWTTEALEDDLHVTGRAVLDLRIALDRPDAHFAVTLEEVTATGSTRMLTQGWLSAMHREGLEAGVPVELGAPLDYRIRTYPFDAWLSEGSSLRLRLSGNEGAGLAAGTGWTGSVDLVATRLTIQVEDAPCGLAVAQVQEGFDPAGCTTGIPRLG